MAMTSRPIPDTIRTYPGTLRGYRAWYPSRLGYLESLYTVWSWKTTERAQCGGNHLAPSVGCQCGLYGWYFPQKALRENDCLSYYATIGVISAFGYIVPHEYGFRAEKARIEALWLPEQKDYPDAHSYRLPTTLAAKHAAVRRRYREKIKIFEKYEDMIKAFPPSRTSELIR